MKPLFCSIVILLLLAGPNSFGQTSVVPQREEDEVLAAGNPPLTIALSDRLVEFFEWSLSSKFTKTQRALFLMKLVQIWGKPDQHRIDVLLKLRKGYDDLARLKKEERDEAQRQLQAVLLDAFPKDPPGSLGEFLLSVYASSHPEAAAKLKRPQAPVSTPGAVGVVPAELVGEWEARFGSGTSYVNPNTGQHSAPNSTIDSYKIFANGRYEHGRLMQTSLHGCSTTIFGREVGTIMVRGSSLTLTAQPGTIDFKSNCGQNETRPSSFPPKTLGWRVERGEFGLQLCLQNEAGESACFLKQ